MLYDSYAFSKNGLPTITRLDGSTFPSQRSGLSPGDIETYNHMYNRPFFTIEYQNYQSSSSTYYYQHTQDVIVKVYSDAGMTTLLNSPTALTFTVKKVASGTVQPPYTNFYTVTLPAHANSIQIGTDLYSEEYVGGTGNIIYEEHWSVHEFIPSI